MLFLTVGCAVPTFGSDDTQIVVGDSGVDGIGSDMDGSSNLRPDKQHKQGSNRCMPILHLDKNGNLVLDGWNCPLPSRPDQRPMPDPA